jgi:hypothetical protein
MKKGETGLVSQENNTSGTTTAADPSFLLLTLPLDMTNLPTKMKRMTTMWRRDCNRAILGSDETTEGGKFMGERGAREEMGEGGDTCYNQIERLRVKGCWGRCFNNQQLAINNQ